MVVKQHILNNINKLDRLYNTAPTQEATYYSKLAIIELCGWIEFSMDNIAENFATRKLISANYLADFKRIKNGNHGFKYSDNFKKMMCQTIGMHNMETIERPLIVSGEIATLEATLVILSTLRNSAAHTFVNATTFFQAPSVTRSQLLIIYPILRKIGQSTRAL
jgi:hypothetical protein